MTRYWVVGGRYTSTTFERIADGGREEHIGPFDTYDEALKEWGRRSWASVDDCHARYRIVADESGWRPPGGSGGGQAS